MKTATILAQRACAARVLHERLPVVFQESPGAERSFAIDASAIVAR